MKISYKGDYALKIILDLALTYPDKLAHTKDIAQRQDIPKNYLDQIMLTLRQGGFVQSKKGPNGGYALTRPPKDITLGEVVRFIEGPIYPISCVDPDSPQSCDEVNKCGFYEIWQDVGLAISEIIDKITFEEIKHRALRLAQHNTNMYYI